MSSVYGENLRLSIFGQSHSPAVGMTLDGLPAGKKIDMDELKRFLARRAPGQNAWSTARREKDEPEFISGLVNDTLCGAPLIIRRRSGSPAFRTKAGAGTFRAGSPCHCAWRAACACSCLKRRASP